MLWASCILSRMLRLKVWALGKRLAGRRNPERQSVIFDSRYLEAWLPNRRERWMSRAALMTSSIGVLGVFLAGWASNNKYSVVSAMRGAVQMISYEMSLGLCLISAVVLTGTMQVSGIVEAQTGAWNWLIIKGHVPAILAFLVFLVAGNAEANRGPFDLAEAESELTAGYHTEYSGMGFGFYYLAEYLNLFVISGIASTVFLGGWAPLNIGIEGFDNLMNMIPGFIWFFGKTFTVVWLLMWVRWTFPRLRIDQILKLEWKYLMPLSLVILIMMTVCVAFGFHG